MIRLRDIHKEYQNGTKALKGVSMQIDDGDFVFLVGPSGSGKSTIIKLITAEISPTRGKLMVNGYNLNDISEKQIPLMRRTIGVVFQDFRLIEKKTVYENIEVAMRAVGFAREASTAGVNTSLTSPRSRWPWITPSSLTAMPQLSWPRCCSAYRAE